MKVSQELCTALVQKLEPYGLEVEDNDCQQAFWQVINEREGVGHTGDTLIVREARAIWTAKVQQVEAAGSNGDSEPEPEPEPVP